MDWRKNRYGRNDRLSATTRPISPFEGANVVVAWRLLTYGGKEYTPRIEVESGGEGASAKVGVVEGKETPMLGWHSPSYREIFPVKTIRLGLDVRQETRVVTRLVKK